MSSIQDKGYTGRNSSEASIASRQRSKSHATDSSLFQAHLLTISYFIKRMGRSIGRQAKQEIITKAPGIKQPLLCCFIP